ncbi:MAG: flagellar basal body-associated FliL family protein [Bdellovibrionales bacterium]
MGQAKKTGKKRQFIIAGAATLLILAGAGFSVAGRGLISTASAAEHHQAEAEKVEMTYVEIPRMTVFFKGNVPKQMRLDVSLKVASKDVVILEGYLPQIQDKLNACLPRAKIEDLNKPRGMRLFRTELLWEVNNIGIPVPVQDIMLQNMIIM